MAGWAAARAGDPAERDFRSVGNDSALAGGRAADFSLDHPRAPTEFLVAVTFAKDGAKVAITYLAEDSEAGIRRPGTRRQGRTCSPQCGKSTVIAPGHRDAASDPAT
jgi:hypothetical protein